MSAESLVVEEIRRHRWRRFEESIGLGDPTSASFGLGGLARRAGQPLARVLLVPPDPERCVVTLDDPFWTWFETICRNEPLPSLFGEQIRPSATAACLADARGQDQWGSFLAVHASGAVETCVNEHVACWTQKNRYDDSETRFLRLGLIVGQIGAALHTARLVAERQSLQDEPWKALVALLGCQGVVLSQLDPAFRQPHIAYGGEFRPTLVDSPIVLAQTLARLDEDIEREATFEFGMRLVRSTGNRQTLFAKDSTASDFDWKEVVKRSGFSV